MPARDIRLEHARAYCERDPRPRESVRLDFKQDVPAKLGHVISAFANTQGGMILLGIMGDDDNRAVWPPTGVTAKGLSERVQEIANVIHPPVVIDPSEPLPLEEDPSRVVMVVRIPESDSAPHAVDGGRKIYERTGDVGRWEEPIHADRLERMFARRRRSREDGDQLIAQALERSLRLLPQNDPAGEPVAVRYAAVLPAIPGRRSYLSPSDCQILLGRWRSGSSARMPLGGYNVDLRHFRDGKGELTLRQAGFTSIDSNGLTFSCEATQEESGRREHLTREHGSPVRNLHVSVERTWNHARSVFNAISAYYRSADCSPGWLRVVVGLRRCRGVQMTGGGDSIHYTAPQPFLDDEYADELLTPLDDFNDYDAALRPLLGNLLHGFDVRHTNADAIRLEPLAPVRPLS